jgi:arylsulfatase A-like enzyme
VSFISDLKSEGHFAISKDVLFFTADHGECLDGDRDTLGHVPPSLYEDIINVPLVVARPSWECDIIDQQVSLIDIPATVLGALDVALPETMDGKPWSMPLDAERTTVEFVSEWSQDDSEEAMTT